MNAMQVIRLDEAELIPYEEEPRTGSLVSIGHKTPRSVVAAVDELQFSGNLPLEPMLRKHNNQPLGGHADGRKR